MRNLTKENVTDEVQRTFRNSSDARLQQVMCCLVQHLHDFAREVQLSHEEWLAAIDFLVRAGRMSDSRRNEFMLMSDIFGISSLVDLMNQPAGATESSVLGPFHEQGAGESAARYSRIHPIRGRCPMISFAPTAAASSPGKRSRSSAPSPNCLPSSSVPDG